MTLARSSPGMRAMRTPNQQLGPLGAAWGRGEVSTKQLRKFLASSSNTGDDPHGALHTFDEIGAGQGMKQPKQSLGMGGGHINDPINVKSGAPGLMAPEGRGQKDFGPVDLATRGHLDRRPNKRMYPAGTKPHRESDWTNKPMHASTARVKRASAHEYYQNSYFGEPNSRQGR